MNFDAWKNKSKCKNILRLFYNYVIIHWKLMELCIIMSLCEYGF